MFLMFRRALTKRGQPDHIKEPQAYQQVSLEIPKMEIISGVSYEDLPLLGSRPSETMLEYSQLPVLRKLEWRLDDQGQPLRRALKDIVSQTAAFAQTRGSEVSDPCHHCKQKRSVWQSCVVGFDTREGSNMHGSCSSCRFSRRYCTLGRLSLHTFPVPPTDISASRVLRSDDAWPGMDCSDEMSTDSIMANTLPTSTGSSPKHDPKVTEETVWDTPRSVKPEPDFPTSTPSACRLDGKVIPFPLGPETIDDLPLLQEAMHEMTVHLEILKRRVKQLETREQRKGETINPWELV
ncbi:hypothetical protein BO71DRAFT_471650 [Aspergillus ellipticus CBS 707.79]|uniref:Uncharacterized protein n=1 Tax=Aspergillus ellipticus CBS 707.79 TaxID=1448320 RepID=A0A319DQR8_9EURO|nr:hypothetical protein BO71DRAFT_471650 [Aspergillus ellipticus CBS 707.79]